MKKLILVPIVFLISCSTLQKPNNQPNVIVLDSNFAPMKSKSIVLSKQLCFQINENNEKTSLQGSCFNKANWDKLKLIDQDIINAYLDANARKNSLLAKKWKLIKNTPEAKQAKRILKLETHGSRSYALIEKYSQYKSVPLFIRNVTATVAGAQASEKKCSLKQWAKKEINSFKKNALQDHQQRISNILTKNPSVRVVNISLGYKKSWIAEDHPACNKDQVNTEYQVLTDSWRNLLRKHKGVFFVVASGNEGEDFSKTKVRVNDLWGRLAKQSNLIVVGAVDASEKIASFSNFGLENMYWGLGKNIPISYPHPTIKAGYPSMAHGTSSSAAIISGKILKALLQGVDVNDLRKTVSTIK